MRAVVFNLGCKVNQYECDVLAEELFKLGFQVNTELVEADIYVINTCAVTGEAERKSRQMISRCKRLNPEGRIYICGCASEKAKDAFLREGVAFVTGVANKMELVNTVLQDRRGMVIHSLPDEFESSLLSMPQRTRAYVKIQDGCNNFCSYCIIPYLRGRSRSRRIEEIVTEIEGLAQKTREIVLTGINLMHYGADIGVTLTDLIERLRGIDVRIRLGSFYAEALTEGLIKALFSLKRFCAHFHLSLQSGDDGVLKAMNRRYTTADYAEKIELIRKIEPNACITTDVIVGFPGESDEAFLNTARFLEQMQFSDIHIFPFSPREGTLAYSMTAVSGDVIKQRVKTLQALKTRLRNNYLKQNIGIGQEVLVEESIDGYNVGYSNFYLRCYSKKKGEIIEFIPKEIYKGGLKDD